ncbi:MAG: 2-deoxystreptamine N-acetyl-D-glucosaminyltransferase [Gemmatimonadaceae bacterium]|nr:2-deoxystreptamine N-acetyl-D-glucosaminyltransferase [Gemmatimonadaceae bacterium]
MPGLRILHVDSGREWRGGQRQVLLLARYLREHGHEPLVVAYPDAPLIKRVRAAGLAASAMRTRGDWDLAAVRRLRALVHTWRPNIVHAHDARSHAIALAALLGRSDPPPLVVTRRVPFVPRGRLKYGPRVTRFIAISQAVRHALLAGRVPDDKIDVVYSGVPSPELRTPRDWRAESGWARDTVVCGVVGAMTAEKGVQLLAEIAEHLSDQARLRARIVLLGGQASGAARLGGIPAFRAGFVDAVHDAMAGLDVLWHPSRAEGLGTSVIDAMALGVPPVAFAVGGLPELIEHDISGVLVPPGDVPGFAREASSLITDTTRRARLAEHGALRANDFSVERMAAGTLDTYNRVLRDHPAHAARNGLGRPV